MYYLIEIPKCSWCNKSDKMETKTIWFNYRRKKHYVVLWFCKRCNANNGQHIYG